jgi:hypothetical protein
VEKQHWKAEEDTAMLEDLSDAAITETITSPKEKKSGSSLWRSLTYPDALAVMVLLGINHIHTVRHVPSDVVNTIELSRPTS